MTLAQFDYVRKYRKDLGLNIGELIKGTKIPQNENGRIIWHKEINEKVLNVDNGLCVFCGSTSNNLLVLDLDDENLFENFRNYQTLIIKTGKKGNHLYFRTFENPKSQSLTNDKSQHIDILGQGKIAVLPPTIHPDTKRPYEIISDGKIKNLTRNEERELYQKIKDLGFKVNEELKPIKDLHDPNFKQVEGTNRSETLLRVLDSWKIKNPEFTESMLLQLALNYNNEHFAEPYPEDKINAIVKQSFEFGEKNKKDEEKEKPKKKIVKKVKGTINDYYVESILKDGKPFFICTNNGEISFKENIEDEDKIYRPLEPEEQGYFPYSFTTQELDDLINTKQSKNDLLNRIKEQINYFIDLGEIDKTLILIDLLLSYCQEWVNTIHYPYFVGETESGKSTALHLFRWLGYRCLLSEDLPNANIYNFLGLDEEATGTICEDEAQDLALDKEKIRTYKSSYSRGSVKPRIVNSDSKDKKQVYYKTFCLKLFAGERVPEDKGFKERLAVVHMTEGLPDGNIKRVNESAKNILGKLRNALLIWKIQNIDNGLEKVESSLTKRDQELWEDFLSVAYGTKYYDKAREVSEYYINQRHESIWNSLEAVIFKMLYKRKDKDNMINLEDFWEKITQEHPSFRGRLDKQTFYPNNFNQKITRNTLAKLFDNKFQGTKQTSTEKLEGKPHQITKYEFKEEILEKLATKYNVKEDLDDY